MDKQLIKMIVCDLDGTLLRKDKTISQETQTHLIQLQEQGYLLVLASGRYYHDMERYMKQLLIPEHHGYIACGNGLELYQGSAFLHQFDPLTAEEANHLMKEARRHHLSVHVQINRELYASCGRIMNGIGRISQGILAFVPIKQHAVKTMKRFHFTNSLQEEIKQPIAKLCFFGAPFRMRAWKRTLQETYAMRYRSYDLHSFALEVVTCSVGKKAAVQWICDKEGIELTQVIAFGDSGNDEDLLDAAGIGVTMRNGYGPIVKKARILSDKTNEEDGVSDMLHQLLNT